MSTYKWSSIGVPHDWVTAPDGQKLSIRQAVDRLNDLQAQLDEIDKLFPGGGPSRVECITDLQSELAAAEQQIEDTDAECRIQLHTAELEDRLKASDNALKLAEIERDAAGSVHQERNERIWELEAELRAAREEE